MQKTTRAPETMAARDVLDVDSSARRRYDGMFSCYVGGVVLSVTKAAT